MPDRKKVVIAVAIIIAALVLGLVLSGPLLSVESTKFGPLYPNAMASELKFDHTYANADWQDVQGSPTQIVSPIYLDPNLSTVISNYLKASDFRPAMSSTSSVTGIQLDLTAENNNCHDIDATLVVQIGPGHRMGNTRRSGLCPTQDDQSLGGPSDTWGLTISGSDVDSPSFAVWIYMEAQIKPRVTIAQMNAYITISTIAMTFWTNEGNTYAYTLSLTLTPASGKSTTTITGLVQSSPIQSGVTLNLQVRRVGTSVWQTLVTGTTDLTGSMTKTWTPQSYGMTDDGTYIYRVVSDDGTVASDQVAYIQADNPITPPPVTTDYTTLLAYGLLGSAAIVTVGGIIYYKKRH